ncbi:MAG: cupin domain-containing protein [Acidimicrobiia bacterium]
MATSTRQRPPEYLVGSTSGIIHSQDMPWVSQPGIEGSSFKLLRTIPETGGMVFLLRIEPGVVGPRHKHFASAEYFVLQGQATFGTETISEGSYAYELGGFQHTEDAPDEELVMLFITHGPLQVINEDGSRGIVVDTDSMTKAVERFRAEQASA